MTTFKYTMRGRHELKSKNQIPGPGTYNILNYKRRYGIKFGKDKRKGLSQTHLLSIPGPGSYNYSGHKGQRAPRYT